MTKRQVEQLFSVDRRDRERARNILLGHPQGITNPQRLERMRAYQNNYRKTHRAKQHKADARYEQKARARYGTANERNRFLVSAANQAKKLANRKELYASIERQFAPKGRGTGLKKLLQLSLNFGARREEDSHCKWRGRTSTAKRAMDLLKMSKVKRGVSKGKKANGRKVGGKVSITKDIH